MKKELTNFANKFFKEVLNENAAIFAGAGLSKASGYMNWKELLTDIADELGLDINREDDLVSLAQYYENAKGGRGSINDKLIDEFTRDAVLTDNHKILASMTIETYWTTNYDALIEKSLESAGKTIDVKRCVENLAINVPRRDAIIYKMHGDISLAHEAVLTKDDYESYNEKRQLFTTALQGDLVSKTFLFIGFSFEDPNLEYILSRIRILLGNNKRDHYCFFKEIKRTDFENNNNFEYATIKQNLKIKDLKRYSIQALLVDEYQDITDILMLIQSKLQRRNIFISGAAVNYEPFGELRANNMIYNLANKLASSRYSIISGFGLGVGSSVINGVLSKIYSNKKLHLDDYLILRPFPQNISDSNQRKILWQQYREDMISKAGIAIFLFGNKKVENNIVDSDGLIQEFGIAISLGIKVLPVGCTGSASKNLWDKVTSNMDEYFPKNDELRNAVISLGDPSLSDTDIINNLIKAINLLQEIL